VPERSRIRRPQRAAGRQPSAVVGPAPQCLRSTTL
jgi:hypothetical protein